MIRSATWELVVVVVVLMVVGSSVLAVGVVASPEALRRVQSNTDDAVAEEGAISPLSTSPPMCRNCRSRGCTLACASEAHAGVEARKRRGAG